MQKNLNEIFALAVVISLVGYSSLEKIYGLSAKARQTVFFAMYKFQDVNKGVMRDKMDLYSIDK